METLPFMNPSEMDELEIALSSIALFEQYDDEVEAANDDSYENLYPAIG